MVDFFWCYFYREDRFFYRRKENRKRSFVYVEDLEVEVEFVFFVVFDKGLGYFVFNLGEGFLVFRVEDIDL